TTLKSTYSKNMFRILKQFKHTGYLKMKINDFRERLDIPTSYRMTDINKNVLKPIINELSYIFKALKIHKVRAKKGRKIEYLEFIFEPENRIYNKKYAKSKNTVDSRQYISREKTPQWLEDRKYTKKVRSDIDPQLEKDREAFLKQLQIDWDE
ncbi:RepB family plasmid replication initiator protein, partial [Pseudomonas aeruginosa]|nr:RepB family plasmid replication initiator protein [Pseudomonas aeruginosa]